MSSVGRRLSEMYQKIVRYRFEVCGTPIDITEICDGGKQVVIEEVEKNGQEDTHMSGVLGFDGSKWAWVEGERMFCRYGSVSLANGIVEYLNCNGVPVE